jgi:hypothetical protein
MTAKPSRADGAWVSRGATRLALAMAVGLAAAGCSKQAGGSTPDSPPPQAVTVPFVGCPQDGAYGPSPAPTGADKVVPLDAATASKLAYYADILHGVLGPRGWTCFGTAGSSERTLYVAPPPVTAHVMDSDWSGLNGPIVELYESSSGFDVARYITRVFPAHQAFAQSWINESREPASEFPTGVPATDRVTTLSNELVEYETPPNTDGLGVSERLQPSEDPLVGSVLLRGQTSAVVFTAVRLTPDLRELAPAIIGQVERDNGMGH